MTNFAVCTFRFRVQHCTLEAGGKTLKNRTCSGFAAVFDTNRWRLMLLYQAS